MTTTCIERVPQFEVIHYDYLKHEEFFCFLVNRGVNFQYDSQTTVVTFEYGIPFGEKKTYIIRTDQYLVFDEERNIQILTSSEFHRRFQEVKK